MEEGCVWCGRPFGQGSTRLAGRVLCGSCGVATTSPWPSASELNEAYGSWYRPEAGRFAGIGDRLFAFLRGSYARRLDALAPPGPILDVGAGEGHLVRALRARGRKATGLDPYSHSETVASSSITEITGTWAAVVFWHSLEHMPNPAQALETASGLLQDRGVLVVAVPNTSSLQARAFGDDWLHLDLPRHLVHIPAEQLVARLQELGLRIGRVNHYRGGAIVFGWLHGILRRLSSRFHLYDAVRKAEARSESMSGGTRAVVLLLGSILLPLAGAAAVVEVALRKGGTVCVEARRI